MISFLPDFIDILMIIIAEKGNTRNHNKLSNTYQKNSEKVKKGIDTYLTRVILNSIKRVE